MDAPATPVPDMCVVHTSRPLLSAENLLDFTRYMQTKKARSRSSGPCGPGSLRLCTFRYGTCRCMSWPLVRDVSLYGGTYAWTVRGLDVLRVGADFTSRGWGRGQGPWWYPQRAQDPWRLESACQLPSSGPSMQGSSVPCMIAQEHGYQMCSTPAECGKMVSSGSAAGP